MSTIPLAKKHDIKKMSYPGHLSIKIDGVPIRCDVNFSRSDGISMAMRTRQGTENVSTQNQWVHMVHTMAEAGVLSPGQHTFIAEVSHPAYTDFKDVSGIVRRLEQNDALVLNIFDYAWHQAPDLWFNERLAILQGMCYAVQHSSFRCVQQFPVQCENSFAIVKKILIDNNPAAEGLVYRASADRFEPGKRAWGYQKIIERPTADLRVHSYEEAIDGKTGEGKGMVGRINMWYGDTLIGVGPGKMKHAERKSEWAVHGHLPHAQERIAEVEYKYDPSYDALREPTFQHWRPEKTEPSYD